MPVFGAPMKQRSPSAFDGDWGGVAVVSLMPSLPREVFSSSDHFTFLMQSGRFTAAFVPIADGASFILLVSLYCYPVTSKWGTWSARNQERGDIRDDQISAEN